MLVPDLVILVGQRLTLDGWQRAIDEQQFLVPLKLEVGQQPGVAPIRGSLGGEPVTFQVVERDLALVLSGRAAPAGVRMAFSAPSGGDLKPCAAGGMALFAYAVRASGYFLAESELVAPSSSLFRKHVDVLLASAFDKEAAYKARYPEDYVGEPQRYDMIVTRINIAGVVTEHSTPIGSLRRAKAP